MSARSFLRPAAAHRQHDLEVLAAAAANDLR